jgi:hypothetical protein
MAHHSIVVGYHGCDRSVGEGVLLKNELLTPKTNPWDWLGTGIYFWEGSPRRALAFAEEKKKRGWGDVPVVEPYVVGALINLGNCFHLADIEAVRELPAHHANLLETLRATGTAIPQNRSPRGDETHDLVLRNLDCAVMNFAMTPGSSRRHMSRSPCAIRPVSLGTSSRLVGWSTKREPMTQDERNRQVHDELIREFHAMTLDERVQLLMASGILTRDRQLAPEYVTPSGVAPECTGDPSAPK